MRTATARCALVSQQSSQQSDDQSRVLQPSSQVFIHDQLFLMIIYLVLAIETIQMSDNGVSEALKPLASSV